MRERTTYADYNCKTRNFNPTPLKVSSETEAQTSKRPVLDHKEAADFTVLASLFSALYTAVQAFIATCCKRQKSATTAIRKATKKLLPSRMSKRKSKEEGQEETGKPSNWPV